MLVFRDNIGSEADYVIIPVDETGTPEFVENGYIEVGVNPATLEPVRARPIIKWIDGRGEAEHCPNCGSVIYARGFKCCQKCGMALDWSEDKKG